MATAPRHASTSSLPSDREPVPAAHEPATVEESLDEHELLSILREAAASGAKALESVLEAVADAARALSGADGTALGLETKGTITCRARSGNIAPPLGASITTTSGISGECLRTGTMLVCHDVWTDPRVDAEVCRNLGIRAIAAVPVRDPSGVAGILEAFSARPNAFDADALKSLRELAGIAETAYARDSPAHAVAPKPPVALALRPSFRTAPRMPVVPATSYSTPPLAPDDVASGSEPSRGRLWIVAAAALTLLLAIAVAWWSWQSPDDEASGGAQTVRAASPQPANPAPPHQTPLRPGPDKPEAGVPSNHSQRARPAIVEDAADLNPIEVTLENDSGPISAAAKSASSADAPRADADAEPIEPPSVALAASAGSKQLDSITNTPAQMPVAGLRVSQGVAEAALVHKVSPAYPMRARTERLTGTVILSAAIGVDGSVGDIDVVKGSPLLAEAAKAAVRQWRYRPATLNGSAITVQKQITFVFTLP